MDGRMGDVQSDAFQLGVLGITTEAPLCFPRVTCITFFIYSRHCHFVSRHNDLDESVLVILIFETTLEDTCLSAADEVGEECTDDTPDALPCHHIACTVPSVFVDDIPGKDSGKHSLEALTLDEGLCDEGGEDIQLI